MGFNRMTIAKLLRLLDYPAFTGKLRGPEDALAIEVANYLRAASLEGKLKATWTKIQPEVGWSENPTERGRAKTRMAKAKAMGQITGTPDFVIVGETVGGWIELKAKGGSLSDAQKDFSEWCQWINCRHSVCRSLDDVVRTLISWGVLQP